MRSPCVVFALVLGVGCRGNFDLYGDSVDSGGGGGGGGDGSSGGGDSGGGCDGSESCLNPFIWYTFDEAAGASAFANSGTWPGNYSSYTGTLGVAGKRGNAIQLAATDAITIADPSDGALDDLATWTVEAWINMSTLPRNGISPVLTKMASYGCSLGERSSGCTDCYTVNWFVSFPSGGGGGGWDIATVPTANSWFHLACSYSGPGAMAVYWNGTLLDSITFDGGPTSNTTSSVIVGSNGSNSFEGLVDDLKLWKTVLGDQQVCLNACGSFAGGVCTFDGICGN